MTNEVDFLALATENEKAKATRSNDRPTKQIRAQWKGQLLSKAFAAIVQDIVETDGVVITEGHFDVSQEDKIHNIRTTFNAMFGPEHTYTAEQAHAVYEKVTNAKG